MATIHPLFAGVLGQHFPGLQQPAPVEAEVDEEDEDADCEYCGCPDVIWADDSDPSVGYYNQVAVCANCRKEVD
jgi:hypothetical protein